MDQWRLLHVVFIHLSFFFIVLQRKTKKTSMSRVKAREPVCRQSTLQPWSLKIRTCPMLRKWKLRSLMRFVQDDRRCCQGHPQNDRQNTCWTRGTRSPNRALWKKELVSVCHDWNECWWTWHPIILITSPVRGFFPCSIWLSALRNSLVHFAKQFRYIFFVTLSFCCLRLGGKPQRPERSASAHARPFRCGENLRVSTDGFRKVKCGEAADMLLTYMRHSLMIIVINDGLQPQRVFETATLIFVAVCHQIKIDWYISRV